MKRLDAKVIGLGKGKEEKKIEGKNWTSENFKIFIFGYYWWMVMAADDDREIFLAVLSKDVSGDC